MKTVTLAEELALLAYDNSGSDQVGRPQLDYALAGAILVELALARRIAVERGRVVVIDTSTTGDPILDGGLARIVGDRWQRKPKEWVDRLSKGLRERVLDGLAGAGILRREHERVLRVFSRTRYPSPVEPTVETHARQRLRAAAISPGPVEPRTAALCALVRALHFESKVFTGLPRSQVRARLKEISDGDWAAAATKRAIEEAQAAVMAAVMVPVWAAGASSS